MQDYFVVWLLQFIGAISSFPSLLSGAIGFDSLTLLSRSCREVPAYAAFYGTFEASKRALTPKGAKPSDLAIHWVMFSGSVAGIGYWTACYPLDLIKTKIQSEPLVGPNSSARAPSIISVGAKIVKSHGVRALWKGFATCITRTIPAGAATFTAYEITAKILGL
jgi:solute carrier family 25 carnitine/acylcarnitine transporter 20/29